MQNEIQKIHGLIQQKRIGEAEALCKQITANYPDHADAWIQLARIGQLKGDGKAMLHFAQNALKAAPDNYIALLQEAEALLHLLHVNEASEKLRILEKTAAKQPRVLQHVAELYTYSENHQAAMRCYKQAHKLIGDDAGLLYNMANAAIALGDGAEAERLLDVVIAKNPHDYDAYYNRATYRKQTADDNHTREIENLLSKDIKNPGGEVQLHYALAKEYEDLENASQAFAHLKKGADKRRAMLSYDVKDDVGILNEIGRIMDGAFLRDVPATSDEAGPVFILGLPRSGTTLVDRIISSHSQVQSLGEINDFAVAMMALAPKATSKTDLIAKTTEIDFSELANMYLRTTAEKNKNTAYLIDKTPANFLYIGLIAKSLPNAKIIHLRRQPMDSCYAMYKTLFRMGYPFSYDLDDLGKYYVAYRALMDHWDDVLPGRVLHVDYEKLVSGQEAQSKRLIAHLGLDWEQGCLDFHENKSASSTASAAQVRQPLYSSSVDKWKLYESDLAPLKARLEKAGIAV
jgi:thioredoxin-like negative regulator of GroEL